MKYIERLLLIAYGFCITIVGVIVFAVIQHVIGEIIEALNYIHP